MKKSTAVFSSLGVVVVLVVCVFVFAPAELDKSFNKVEEHAPYLISEQALQLHKSLFIGDWHADTTLWERDLVNRNDYGHIDIPRLQEGNVAIQMFTSVTKSPSGINYERNETEASDNVTKIALVQRWPLATLNSLTARAIVQADKIHRLAEQDSDNFMLLTSKQQLEGFLKRRLTETKLVAGLLGTEGSHALDGKLENIQVLYDKGFRMMSLQHFFDNKLGGSLHGTSDKGLTAFGREAVLKMRELGIMLDVSHSSEQVVEDVLAMGNEPLLISHSGFHGHCQSKRNISDKLMQAIAANGGLIAVGYWDGALCGNSPKLVAESIKYGIQLVGADHLALGSDFDGATTTAFDTSELAVITQELLTIGLTEEQIRKVMGDNMLRFLRQNLP
jgi:membrane dipeptidase